MTDQRGKAEQFRELHVPGKPLILFNIWDVGSAKAVANAGANAIATGSWSVAHANGFDDGERIPLPLVIDNLRRAHELSGATVIIVTHDTALAQPRLGDERVGRAEVGGGGAVPGPLAAPLRPRRT